MPPTSASLVTPTPQEAEVNFLNTTLSQLGKEIQFLIAKQAQCLRRLNEVSATTAILPTEMLSTIFEHACSELRLSPVTLGAVCSHWRETAWSSPSLWSTFSTSFALDRKTVPRRSVDLLCLHFLNARSVPVSIQLADRPPTLPRHPKHPPMVPFRDLIELIFRDNAQRLGGFILESVDEAWWEVICDLIRPEALINFRLLELGGPVASKLKPFISIPSLKELSLHTHVDLQLYPWSQLTYLKLSRITIDVCFSLLLQCPSLAEYHCHKPRVTYSNHYAHLLEHEGQNVTLAYLHTLEWSFQDDEWTHFLLTSMSFPSLCHLRCSSLSSGVRGSRKFWTFVDNFIASLKLLRTFHGDICFFWDAPRQCDNDDSAPFNEAFQKPQLEELHLRQVDSRGSRFIFRQLARTDITLLPSLRLVSIEGDASQMDWYLHEPSVYSQFVDFLIARRDGDDAKWRQVKRLEMVRFKRKFLGPKKPCPDIFHQLPLGATRIIRRLVGEGLKLVDVHNREI